MTSLVSFINNFKRDIVDTENEDECKKFFFKSITHLMVSLEITSSSILDEKIDFLKLRLSIPSAIGTEKQVKNVLNEGIKKKFYLKKNYLTTNKKPYYRISKKFSLMITNWYLDNKSEFN